MPEAGELIALLVILGIAAIAGALGLGLGIVVAPRLARLVDRANREDEEADDGG